MDVVYLILGVIFLGGTTIDLIWTTLWVDGGAGPLTRYLMRSGWNGMRIVSGDSPRVLRLAGPFMIGITLATWIVLIWFGWACLFASGEEVLISTEGEPITWASRLYFVGYTMFTLGIGDIIPSGGFWQIVTILVTANGMFFITMSVSYIVSVLGAVTLKRTFASTVTGLGMKSEDVVRRAWNGEEFYGLNELFSELSSEIGQLTYQHQAYPILHYYHCVGDKYASTIATVILDEALTILTHGIPEEHRPETIHLANARSTIRDYLVHVHASLLPPAEDVPPPPNLDILRASGIPTVSDEEFHAALDDLSHRRRRLLNMIEADAREWPD